jgi:diguanylate cyclase
MADDTASQQLDEWKRKYYASLTSLEQQQGYDEVLQRSLGRLALAAQGLDPTLDKQLKSLRDVLRGKKDQQEIEKILIKMEKAITQMEETSNKKNSQTAGEIVAELLLLIKLAKPFKAEAKTLAKQLSSATNQVMPALIPQVLTLLDSVLNQTPTEKTSSFNFNIFGKSKPLKEEPASHPETEPQILADDLDSSSANKIPTHRVLMDLLERLSLPTDLSKKATKIRHQIETGIDDAQLPAIINDIADIISTLGSQVVTDKHDYEEFLKSLTSRLNELDQQIRTTITEDATAFEQLKVMGQAVDEQVLGIRNEVEDADDLDRLKSTVSDRLDFLNQHFENYRRSDHQRFTESQQQIKELNSRLQAMEQESVELRESAEKSRDLALKDALTGIWNRQALNEDLEKEYVRWQRYQKPLSLVVWDIDLFKRVNDEYGHAAGDKVLKTIARIFMQATRDADFIARFGGEEFVGIFPETRLEDALTLANKIRDKVANSRFHYENKPVLITASAGLATFRPNDTIDDVFKRADAALYRAKASGRNCCLAD